MARRSRKKKFKQMPHKVEIDPHPYPPSEIKEWLKQQSLKGMWAWDDTSKNCLEARNSGVSHGPGDLIGYRFYGFTDPSTAVHFKLRFG